MIFRFCLITTFLSLLIVNAHSQENPYFGTISGTIVDKDTKQPLQGVTIRLINTKLGAVSRSDGKFIINWCL